MIFFRLIFIQIDFLNKTFLFLIFAIFTTPIWSAVTFQSHKIVARRRALLVLKKLNKII